MIEKIRVFMKKCYEKCNFSKIILYFISLVILVISRKYKGFISEANEAINDHVKDKSNISKIKRELILFRVIYKIRPNEYFLYDFSSRSYSDRDKYITREMTNGYYKLINNFDALKIFNDKYLSYKVFKDLFNRDMFYYKDEEDKEEFINFVKKNNSFVLKPVDGHGGVGIRFLSLSDYKSALELYDSVKEFSPFVVEEIVNQSLDMASFHPESLNTVRVVTFQNYGHMSIVWAFLRVGQGDSNVDNMTSGGLGALVDNETGIVISDAIDYKGSKVVSHPDSNVVFKGFKLPDWEGLKSILAKLSAKVPSAHCIGWDMAHTDKGWVLIEGNGRAQVVTIQVLNDKGYKPLFEKMAYLCNVDCGDENDEEE